MSQVHTWSFGSGNGWQASGQVWPVPAVVAWHGSTGHRSELETEVDRRFRAAEPFELHQVDLDATVAALGPQARRWFQRQEPPRGMLHLSAVAARVEGRQLHAQFLGTDFALYVGARRVDDGHPMGPSLPRVWDADVRREEEGWRHRAAVPLPDKAAVLALGGSLARLPDDTVAAELAASRRFGAEVLPRLGQLAMASPNLPGTPWGCAVAIWP